MVSPGSSLTLGRAYFYAPGVQYEPVILKKKRT